MREERSNFLIFVFYKFGFLFALLLVLMTEFEAYFKNANSLTSLVIAVCFLAGHLYISKKIVRAIISERGIKTHKQHIPWSDIQSVNRILHIYIALKTDGERICFPVGVFPIGPLEIIVNNSRMDILIRLMLKRNL